MAYDDASLAPLAAGLAKLPAADQFGLLKDGFALGMAGDVNEVIAAFAQAFNR